MKTTLRMRFMLLLFALIVGCGPVWAQSTATITFASQTSGTGDSSTAYSTDNFVSSGIASSSTALGTITCSATERCYSGKTGYGLKAGGNSTTKPGSFTIAFSPLANVTKITLNRASYNDSKTATITVKNGSTSLGSASTPSGTAAFSDMEITGLSIESLSGLTVETSQYCYIKSITITYGNDKATTTTISDSGITNTNKFLGTAAGSLSASVTYGSPATEVPYASVTWSGNNDDVATINSTTGAVTLVGAGTVTFTASFEGLTGYSNSSATYVMTVTNEDPALSTIWSEDFYSYSADAVPSGGTYSYACTNGTKTSGSTNGGTTAVKNENLAEGTKPELMVGKKGSGEGALGGSFSATIPLWSSSNGYGYSGDLTLTYKTNDKGLNVKTTTLGITVEGEASAGAGVTYSTKETHTVTFKGVTTSTENITIVFTATTTNNVRLDDILLKGVVTIPVNGDNEITNNVTIPAGVSYVVPSTGIKVPSGKTLTVNGTLVNTTAANLVIEDGGQLITSNAVKATVQKNIGSASTNWATASDGWNFIASPVSANVDPSSVGMITDGLGNTATTANATYDLYYLNPAAETGWKNYRNSTFDLVNGKGYLYASKAGITPLAIAGEVKAYTAPQSVEVAAGWNLIGNPFTFNVYANQNYYKMNGTGTALASVNKGEETIAPCTGIVVEASNAGSVTFSKEAPDGSANNGNLELTLTQAVANRNTRGEKSLQTLDNAIVSFNEGSELGKFYFGTQNANIYIPKDNEEYAIVSAEARGEMPVNFKAAQDGQYTITVNPENVEMGYLHLIDNIAGTDIDLLANPSYSFNAKSDDYESRFRLVFSANNENQNENEKDFAFFSNGQLIVTGEGTLHIIDMMGRVISTEVINGTSSKAINAKAGVYVLRLTNGENVKTQKIVIR